MMADTPLVLRLRLAWLILDKANQMFQLFVWITFYYYALNC